MPATRPHYPRPDAATLDRLYAEMGLTCPDIGWLYERDATTVRGWLVQAGIPTRPRGTPHAGTFRPGHQLRVGTRHSPKSIEKIRAASIARGAVPYLRDGRHWLTGAAPEENPNWKGGATPERQEFYRSPEWTAAVRAVWARDNACCRNCGKDWRTVDRTSEPTFHIHHVWSFQFPETRATPALLVLLCAGCHYRVHSKANTTRAWLPQEPEATHFPGLDQVHYLRAAEREFTMPTLFDVLEQEAA